MEQVKLGVSGSEVVLPIMRWVAGSTPSLPVRLNKQISIKRMSDGSERVGYYLTKREWKREWGYLSKTDLDVFITLQNLNQTLRFQDNNESSDWYYVVLLLLDYGPVRTDILQLKKYYCRITLKEI